MSDHIGVDRRMPEQKGDRNTAPMSIVISGNKFPMATIIAAVATLVVSLFYAGFWLANLEERTLQNTRQATVNSTLLKEQGSLIRSVQQNLTITSTLLESLLERVEDLHTAQIRNDAEDREYHRRFSINEAEDRMFHKKQLPQ